MDEASAKKTIRESVMDVVKNQRVEMRPKWHFILRAVLAVIGAAIIALTLLYAASLFIFIMARTGILVAPIFGFRGIFVFLISLPWLLISLILIFTVFLEIFVRHYAFAYRQPVLYSALAIVAVVALGGFALASTPLHGMLSHCDPPAPGMPTSPVPCGGGVYRDLDPRRLAGIHKGTIVQLDSQNFYIENLARERLLIRVFPRTRLPFGADFRVGDIVVVLGDLRESEVDAFGIKKIDF